MLAEPSYAGISSLLRRASSPNADATRSPREWSELVETAVRDGLGGLVLEAIDVHGLEAPEFATRQLGVAARSVARKTEQAIAAIEPLLRTLNDADIPVMLLKGAALHLTCYDAPDLRPMSDVDLLVRERDALRAVDVLRRAGCHEGQELLREDFFPRFYYETELVGPGPAAVRIDLHARPLRPIRFARLVDETEFWRDARSVSVGRSSALIPAPESMLIHLAAHAAFHGCSRLIWLYDLDRWVRRLGSSIDWARFEHLCAAWQLSLAVRDALDAAERLFGDIVPDETRVRLANRRTDWRDRLVLRQAPRDAGSPWLHVVTDVLCTPGLRFRLAYLFAHLRPGRGHLAGVYPFRHKGWPVVAAAYRMARATIRLFGAWRDMHGPRSTRCVPRGRRAVRERPKDQTRRRQAVT